jgi:hypothetical protein
MGTAVVVVDAVVGVRVGSGPLVVDAVVVVVGAVVVLDAALWLELQPARMIPSPTSVMIPNCLRMAPLLIWP